MSVSFIDVYTRIINEIQEDIPEFTMINSVKEDKVPVDLMSSTSGVFLFAYDPYVSEILASYKTINDVWQQLEIDFPRTSVRLNNNYVTLDEFLHEMKQFKRIGVKINGEQYDLEFVTSMLCNQSSYALPFIITHSLFATDRVGVCNTSANREIRINTYYRTAELEAEFAVVEYDTGCVRENINIIVCLDLSGKSRYGVVKWKK